MRCPVSPSIGHGWRGLALVTVLLAGACGQPPTPAATPGTPGDIRSLPAPGHSPATANS